MDVLINWEMATSCVITQEFVQQMYNFCISTAIHIRPKENAAAKDARRMLARGFVIRIIVAIMLKRASLSYTQSQGRNDGIEGNTPRNRGYGDS